MVKNQKFDHYESHNFELKKLGVATDARKLFKTFLLIETKI